MMMPVTGDWEYDHFNLVIRICKCYSKTSHNTSPSAPSFNMGRLGEVGCKEEGTDGEGKDGEEEDGASHIKLHHDCIATECYVRSYNTAYLRTCQSGRHSYCCVSMKRERKCGLK